MVERIADALSRTCTLVDAPGRRAGAWAELARRLRLGLDYLRFLDPRYATTPHLRQRARERAPRLIVRLAESRAGRAGRRPARAASLLDASSAGCRARGDRAVPRRAGARRAADHAARRHRLAAARSLRRGAARSASARCCRSGSWDHLSSKALLRAMPDACIVWNEMQRREAVELHGVPADRVVVTGAQCYDQWFDRAPARRPRRRSAHASACAPIGRSCSIRLLVALPRHASASRRSCERWIQRAAQQRRSAAEGHRHPDPAASGAARRVARRRSVRVPQRRVLGRAPGRRRGEGRLLRLDVLQRRRRRHQHQRVHRGGGGRQAGARRCCCRRSRATTRKARCTSTTCSTSTAGCCARRARSTSTCRCWPTRWPATAAATRRRRGSSTGSCVRSAAPRRRRRGSSRPSSESATSPAPQPRAREAASAVVAWLLLFPMACRARAAPADAAVAQADDATGCARSYERLKLLDAATGEAVRVTDQFIAAGKRRKSATPVAASALTPKAGRQRDPAKTLAGTDVREATDTRELVTVLGRSGRPIILGPWLSETGFELLYWIPFLAWAKAYGNFDPDRLVVVSRGGAAPWYRHITPHYEEIFSFYTPDEFRVAQRAADRRAAGPAEAHRDLVVRSRDPRRACRRKRGLSGRRAAAPVGDVPAVRALLVPADAGDAGRGVHARSRRLPPPPPTRHPARSCPSATSRRSSTATGAAADTREPRVRGRVPGRPGPAHRRRAAEHRAAVRRSRRLSAGAARPRCTPIEHLMTPENNLAVQTEVIRHAAGVRRHLRRLLVSGAALRREHAGVLFAPERLPLRSPRGGQARVRRRCAAARSPRWTCARRTSLRLGFAGADQRSIGSRR